VLFDVSDHHVIGTVSARGKETGKGIARRSERERRRGKPTRRGSERETANGRREGSRQSRKNI